MAEAVRMGTASIQNKKNGDLYFKWLNNLNNITKPEEKKEKPNLWDYLGKKKRSVLIN
jgi:hypothetical protein